MKWNQDIRRIVYKRLLEEFGPCSEWKSKQNPTGDKKVWKEFCSKVARGLTEFTGNNFIGKKWDGAAIEAQIAWGIQEKQSVIKNTGGMTNFIYNRSIALEVGLIKAADIPNFALFDKK